MKQDETQRKCIVCGQVKPKEKLLRFATTEDGYLLPDFNKKIKGKGVYVFNSRQVLSRALKNNLFMKATHQNLKIDENMLEIVEKLLFNKGLQSINLAIKAGAVVTGFEKVRDKLIKGQVAFLIEAKDAAPDGCRKLESVAQNLPIFRPYLSAELDAALDRVNTVHMAVLKGHMEKMVYENIKKYQDFID